MRFGPFVVVALAALAFVTLGAGSASAAIDSFNVQGTSGTFAECDNVNNQHSNTLANGGTVTGSGPYHVSHTFSPASSSASCAAGSGTDSTSGSMSSTGTISASGALSLSDSSQGSTTATASFTGDPINDCVDVGEDIGTTTTVQFTLAQATTYSFSGTLSSSGTQAVGLGRVSYSLIRTSAPSGTIFDESQGLSPNVSGTLAAGSYQYRVHGDASNDFACDKSGTETDSYGYNVQLKVGASPPVPPPPKPPPSKPPPSNTAPPSISGVAAVNHALTCSNGSWTNAPKGFTHQWNRDGVPIPGATSQKYVLQPADQGHTVTCTVVASNTGGSSPPRTSAGVMVPAAATCTLSARHKITVLRTRTHRIRGGRLAVRVVCNQVVRATLAATLLDHPPGKRHHTRHFTPTAKNTTLQSGVVKVLKLKLPAAAVKDLLRGAREHADLVLIASNLNGTTRVTARIGPLRT